MSRTYTYRDDSGYREILDASSMEEATEMAEELLRSGEWGENGASVTAWVTLEEGDKVIDRESVTVEISPDHEALIHKAAGRSGCGTSPDDHDWTREGEGGCDQNPGVWSTGRTSMLYRSHCRTCGLQRREMTCGDQRDPGEHDRVEYTMPGSWCKECQSDSCDCKESESEDGE